MYEGTPPERAYSVHISRNRFLWTTHKEASRKSVGSRKNELFCAPRTASRGKLKRTKDFGYDDTGISSKVINNIVSSWCPHLSAVDPRLQPLYLGRPTGG
ncbi:uncharacterized protein Bfra_005042 [Botrytis fragariae]|uniref:Uncharacterized protein n=1 Tax=Botrytis fragariae TaxID=1964551 RepID=A0A8H6ATW4_9HELO|nr:uncharacterized protein Bfra_005042 [Botrytis fragariae]KAF5873579.1 hypothetical protein Bfra_005042 [Botrytis fragariae]